MIQYGVVVQIDCDIRYLVSLGYGVLTVDTNNDHLQVLARYNTTVFGLDRNLESNTRDLVS